MEKPSEASNAVEWKTNTKKQALKSIDPQEIVNQYGGSGIFSSNRKNKCVDEYITLPYVAGKTFDKAIGKYTDSHRIQIKYTKNGTHVFPVKERSET